MRSARRVEPIRALRPLPYDLLVRVNRQLVGEKIELIEEIRQLRAAVNIYRELVGKIDRKKLA